MRLSEPDGEVCTSCNTPQMFDSQETLTAQVSIRTKASFSRLSHDPDLPLLFFMFYVSQTVDLCPKSTVCLISDWATLYLVETLRAIIRILTLHGYASHRLWDAYPCKVRSEWLHAHGGVCLGGVSTQLVFAGGGLSVWGLMIALLNLWKAYPCKLRGLMIARGVSTWYTVLFPVGCDHLCMLACDCHSNWLPQLISKMFRD